jgi:lipid II:glycine glycyltransferase (peptidoglycan interpeptide bridge formation enzyme)
MLYYLGGSTRDRELTAKQAPAAVFWHAIRQARLLGMARFDLGGCTPTSDPNDARYGVYTFKKRWGGRIETFYNHEVVLSPAAVRFQEQVLSPAWDRLHPLYFRLMDRIRKPEPRLLD